MCGWKGILRMRRRVRFWKVLHLITQRLLGLSMEDPTPPLDTPEVFGGLKTRLFEGPKLIGSVWVGKSIISRIVS